MPYAIKSVSVAFIFTPKNRRAEVLRTSMSNIVNNNNNIFKYYHVDMDYISAVFDGVTVTRLPLRLILNRRLVIICYCR